MIDVKVIEHSVSHCSPPLATVQATYPRFIHAELLTHRVQSRNSSSSRAIPTSKLSAQERIYPAVWDKNIPGMQAGEELSPADVKKAKRIWDRMANACEKGAAELAALGLHKQWANRPLEWFTPISVVVTSMTWSNLLGLRYHGDAQPEIQMFAEALHAALSKSKPKFLEYGEWHLPYVSKDEVATLGLEDAKKASAARCARVSYLTHDGKKPSLEKDLELFERLAGAQPIHASPLEHQATPDRLLNVLDYSTWERPELHGNLRGWIQHRKLLPGENISVFEKDGYAPVF